MPLSLYKSYSFLYGKVLLGWSVRMLNKLTIIAHRRTRSLWIIFIVFLFNDIIRIDILLYLMWLFLSLLCSNFVIKSIYFINRFLLYRDTQTYYKTETDWHVCVPCKWLIQDIFGIFILLDTGKTEGKDILKIESLLWSSWYAFICRENIHFFSGEGKWNTGSSRKMG